MFESEPNSRVVGSGPTWSIATLSLVLAQSVLFPTADNPGIRDLQSNQSITVRYDDDCRCSVLCDMVDDNGYKRGIK